MRDQRIDFWRGVCVVGMALWHMLSHGSFPRWFSFPWIQGLNFVAEGFVLISGMCVGIGLSRHPPGTLRIAHSVRRALAILGIHYLVVGGLLAGAWAKVIRIPYVGKDFWQKGLWEHLKAVATLKEQFYLADILPVFFFLFLSTPVWLFLLQKTGQGGLLAISALIYLGTLGLAWLWPDWHRLLEVNHAGAFDGNTWQFVYVVGMLLGARYVDWGEAGLARQARKAVGWAFLAWLPMAGVYLALKLRFEPADPVQKLLLDRHPLGPVRLGYVGLQLAVIGLAVLAWWETLAPFRLIRTVALMGRSSLIVFVCSVFLDYLFKQAIDRWQVGFPANLVFPAAELVLLSAVAWIVQHRPLWKRPV